MLRTRILDEDSPYVTDESKIKGNADLLLIPDNEDDIIEAVKAADASRIPITVSAMRTGMSGGCVPFGGNVLTVEKLNKVIGAGKDDKGFFIRIQPAVTVRDLNELIRKKAYSKLKDITEGAVAELIAGKDHFYPIDPTELNSSIGGNIATNASGPRTLKYGPTRDRVRRLRIILSDGSVLDLKRGDIVGVGREFTISFGAKERKITIPSYDFNMNVKNSAGVMCRDNMDLIDLFVGSEGLFGIVTEADVYITEWHPLMSNILFFPSDQDAYSFVKELRTTGIEPEFLEFLDSRAIDLIREVRKIDPRFTGMPELPDPGCACVFMDLPIDSDLKDTYSLLGKIAENHGGSLDNSWCGHELRDRERFFGFRHSVPQTMFERTAAMKDKPRNLHKMGSDMSVPLDRLDDMVDVYNSELDAQGLDRVTFGHIGNGHLHMEIMLDSVDDFNRAKIAYHNMAEKAIEFGGSPSAEHGIGKIKREYIRLLYGDKGVEEIKALKTQLDPNWIFSPGNMVDR
ncbi:MAG: FAD-binding oxidoreductase [Candidatus Methanoplasma sp.]|jgi:D-lactate dehydrogenase (cytochrome)|nr:FAD-binding oxidoreductase [Candidatus Methanoplasma sp.]